MMVFSRSHSVEGTGTFGGVLAAGIAPDHEHRQKSGHLHLGILTLPVFGVARMARRCGHVLATKRLRIGFSSAEGCWGLFLKLVQSEFDGSLLKAANRV